MKTINLTNEVVIALDASEIDGNELKLVGQLDRTLYLAVNKALEALGGKWNRKAKAHIFEGDPREAIENAILSGSVERLIAKDPHDFFPTPPELVERLLELADIQPGDKVLEPSAGDGSIVRAIFEADKKACVCAYEIDPDRSDALEEEFSDFNFALCGHDFLDSAAKPSYDRIAANPPFSRRRDIHHATHMYRSLKPGGRLVCVMAASITFREDNLTQNFLENVPATEIIELGQGAFKTSGTMVNAIIYVADKPE